jgi:Domain of unknown function (DUF4399)
MKHLDLTSALALCAALILPCMPSHASSASWGALEQRCWQRHTRERTKVDLREPTAVYFSNLRDGFEVRSPFLVEFAVRGMGVAPAGVKIDRTGHHHILIDRSLPSSVTAQLPFDNSHRHFGKGQTSTTLELPPGRHTLRLLFADHEHRPYFVFSREIAVTVRGPRNTVAAPVIDAADFDKSCARWHDEEVTRPRSPAATPGGQLFFANVRAGERLTSPFSLHLGVEGPGVSARGGSAPKTGHFVLEVLAAANRKSVETYNLSGGATQTNLFIPVGEYRLRLRMVGGEAGADLLPAHEIPVSVIAQEKY